MAMSALRSRMDRLSSSKCFWSMIALVALLLNMNLFNMLPRIQESLPLCPVAESALLAVNSPDSSTNMSVNQPGQEGISFTQRSLAKGDAMQLEKYFLLSKNSARCVQSRRPSQTAIKFLKSVWQIHSYIGGNIYIYSAYYDDRPAAGFLPSLRLLALAGFSAEAKSIFCHVWYDSFAEPLVVAAIVNETGMNIYTFDNMAYKEYTYTCPLTSSRPIPTHVSITTKPMCEPYSTFVSINYVPKQNPLFEFGVCVTNGYGSRPFNEFVEWMELLSIYGVSEVNIYDTQFENMSKIFNYYTERNVLFVHKLPHPLPWDDLWYHKVRNLRTIAFNDCLLRNMYRYRYLVVIDLDEMIVPRHHDNYSIVLDQIDKRLNLTKRSHSYSFFNVFFLQEFPEDKNETFRTLRYRSRVKPSKQYYASKSFVDPLCCFNLFNHYCYTLLPGYAGQKTTVFAPAAIGASHHYRNCGKFYGLPCETLFKEKILDNVMLRVKARLIERVEPVLQLLK